MSEEVSRLVIMSVNDVPPIMRFSKEGEYVYYEDYEKLLTKYNGVFEWLYHNHDQIYYLDTVEEIKSKFDGSLK